MPVSMFSAGLPRAGRFLMDAGASFSLPFCYARNDFPKTLAHGILFFWGREK